MTTTKIINISLYEPHIIKRKPEIEQERDIAIADLLRDNYFALANSIGPYELILQIIENKLSINISGDNIINNQAINMSISQFRTIIKDYFIMCENYFNVSASRDPYRLETIDMARRAIHNEGAELFKNILSNQVAIDFDTARRLFTLMCVMQAK